MIIYIADDEQLALDYCKRTIAKVVSDAEIECFIKPKELLARMNEKPCDVAFLDVEMPGMTGIELAQEIKRCNEKVNIIFTTGYSEYMPDALKMFASGYLLKPITTDMVRDQLLHLRYPKESNYSVSVKCFGLFFVTVNNTPVKFRLQKSREMLAYLVDREGTVVSRRELYTVLFEDEAYDRNAQKNLSKIVHGLEEDLANAGASEIFEKSDAGYRVVKGSFYCDLYDYLDGNKALFHGEYLEQYSWGEDFKARMSDK